MDRIHALASLRALSSKAAVGALSSKAAVGALDDPSVSTPTVIAISLATGVGGLIAGMALSASTARESFARAEDYVGDWDGPAKKAGKDALKLFKEIHNGTFRAGDKTSPDPFSI